MIQLDEDALICDLAETYQILNYRSLPVRLVATLAAGLRDNSRIKLKAAGVPIGLDTILLASIADRIEMFRFGFTDHKGKEPESLVKRLMGEEKTEKPDTRAFNSPEELKRALARARGE